MHERNTRRTPHAARRTPHARATADDLDRTSLGLVPMLCAVQARWLAILIVGCGFHSNALTGDARERDATTRDDAATDAAMIDATPGCSTAGLDCPAGQQVLITGCSTACWVGCTNG